VRTLAQDVGKLLADMGQLPTESKVEVPKILVGLEGKVEALVQKLQAADGSMVLLQGMGGIGKTTLASAVFNELHEQSPTVRCCFLELDPVMTHAQPLKKQKQLLTDLAGEEATKPASVARGRQKLRAKLRGQKVLLVVDNVWGDQLELLLPEDIMEVLGKGSVVLVTSREPGATKKFDGAEVAEAVCLSGLDAMQLLCRHAYGSTSAPAAEEEQVKQLVARCGGLPMALEVVGMRLRLSKDKQRFFSNLEAALTAAYKNDAAGRKDGERTLFAALRLSWDALDAEEQEALLDITWFLKGQPWERVEAHCGYGVLDRLCQFGLVSRGVEQHTKRPTATIHDTIVDLCSSVAGIGRQPRRMALRSCTRPMDAHDMEQVRGCMRCVKWNAVSLFSDSIPTFEIMF
jgi:hypothetical protein